MTDPFAGEFDDYRQRLLDELGENDEEDADASEASMANITR